MRIKVSISNPSQVVNVPCEGNITVAALIVLLQKRVPSLPSGIVLFFDGGKLFEEDSLTDLGIKEGDVIYDSLPNTPGTNTTTTSSSSSSGADPVAAAPSSIPVSSASTTTSTTNNNNNATNNPAISSISNVSNPVIVDDSGNAGAPAPPPVVVDTNIRIEPVVDPIVPAPRLTVEVLMVCFDISSSMKASFVTDLDPGLGSSVVSRVAAAKICFGAFIDKTLAFEFAHAVGLIVFGQQVHEKILISNNLDKFEQIFGELDDSEGATYLYPAVKLSVQRIIDFRKELEKTGSNLANVKSRIICFTDGEDNSGVSAHSVAPWVLENGIVVDAVLIGGSDEAHKHLRSLAHCTGGFTLRIPPDRSALSSVFERESVLALSQRKNEKPNVLPGISLEDFLKFGDVSRYPVITPEGTLSSAPRPTVPATPTKTFSIADVSKTSSILTSATSSNSNSNSNSAPGGAAIKRITAELKSMQAATDLDAEVLVTESDLTDWKVILKGPAGTPYEGGAWMIHLIFPPTYPFSPMKLQFLTPIYHCNVSNEGRVCLAILKDNWSPALTAAKVIRSVIEMLITPDPMDALDAWKGSLARTDPELYKKSVKEHTQQYASVSVADLKIRFGLI